MNEESSESLAARERREESRRASVESLPGIVATLRSTLRNEGIDIISGTEKTRRAPNRGPAGCLGLPLSGFVGALSGIIRGIGGSDLDFLGLVTFFPRERERERVCVCVRARARVYERNWTADQAKLRGLREESLLADANLNFSSV